MGSIYSLWENNPAQTLNATSTIWPWACHIRIPIAFTTHIILPDALLYFSFPIFSPAETQVNIYLLGTAGLWETSGIPLTSVPLLRPIRYSHADKWLNRTFLLSTTIRRISRIFKSERLLYHESPWWRRWRPTGLPRRIWTHIPWSVAMCPFRLDEWEIIQGEVWNIN